MKYIRSFQTNVDRYFFSEDDNEDEDFYLIVNVVDTSNKEGHTYYFDNFDIFRLWCMINKDVIGIIDNYEFDEVFYLCAIRHGLHVKALSLLNDYYSDEDYEDLPDDVASYFSDLVESDEEACTCAIFGVTKITIIQSWGISWLCSLLFGGSSNND